MLGNFAANTLILKEKISEKRFTYGYLSDVLFMNLNSSKVNFVQLISILLIT